MICCYREKKESKERLKTLYRETCARSRTYDDYKAMKELKHKEPKEIQQQTSVVCNLRFYKFNY